MLILYVTTDLGHPVVKQLSVEVILKIFEYSFIPDQSQVCISNRLEVRACQSELLFFKNALFFNGIAKLKKAMYLLSLMPFLNE